MSDFNRDRFDLIRSELDGYEGISTFVETGTLRGERSLIASTLFDKVITIEASDELYQWNCDRHKDAPIEFRHGESSMMLPEVLKELDEPCFIFLDAHWFDMPGRSNGCHDGTRMPLWDEIAAIRPRKQNDIIVIDDVHAFDGRGGPHWDDVTFDNIRTQIGRHVMARKMFDGYAVWR